MALEDAKQMATWPPIGQNNYITPAVSGAPTLTAATKSEMAR